MPQSGEGRGSIDALVSGSSAPGGDGICAVFQQHYAGGKMSRIPLSTVPGCAMDHFEKRNELYIHPDDYVPGNFEQAYVIRHEGEARTYVVRTRKTYLSNKQTDDLLYLFDIDCRGEPQGFGEVRWAISDDDPYFKDTPLVGYTETFDGHLRQGLAVRRLRIMDALARVFWGKPLHSDTCFTSANPIKCWEKLVDTGVAQRYTQGEHDRFVFK